MAEKSAPPMPTWAVWMMMVASAIGTVMLFRDLCYRGWPGPFSS